jgi:ribosomal protein S1
MRARLYSNEELKEHQKESSIKYLNKKYSENEEFRNHKKELSRMAYEKKKRREYQEKNGTSDGFVYKPYNNWPKEEEPLKNDELPKKVVKRVNAR